MTPFEVGVLVGLALIWWAVVGAPRRIERALEKLSEQLSGLEDQLSRLDDLIGRIPGVEDYRPPDGMEWSRAMKDNPKANTNNRRNWVR